MRRRGLNKIWILALALLIALGAVGVTYSAWTDDIYVTGSLGTSGINTVLSCNGTCWEQIGEQVIDVQGTSITCGNPTVDPLTLTFTVTNATPNVDYYCNFTINNNIADTLPIKIVSVTLTPQETTYTGIIGTVPVKPAVDTQLDPGQSAGGTVKISVAPDAPTEPQQNPVFILEVTVKRWNQ
jgi:hypothetical protein